MKNIINKLKEKRIKYEIKSLENSGDTLNAARLSEEKDFPGNAIKLYCKYAEEHIDNGVGYGLASDIAQKNGARAKAIYLAKKFANSYGNRRKWSKVAEVELRNTGDLKEAIRHYEQAYTPGEIISWLTSHPSSEYHKDLNIEINILKEKDIIFQENELKNIKKNYECLERELKFLKNN